MSDGNFNRQLLPKTELSTGLRAGKAQMRSKAEHALKEILDELKDKIPGLEDNINTLFNKVDSLGTEIENLKI